MKAKLKHLENINLFIKEETEKMLLKQTYTLSQLQMIAREKQCMLGKAGIRMEQSQFHNEGEKRTSK